MGRREPQKGILPRAPLPRPGPLTVTRPSERLPGQRRHRPPPQRFIDSASRDSDSLTVISLASMILPSQRSTSPDKNAERPLVSRSDLWDRRGNPAPSPRLAQAPADPSFRINHGNHYRLQRYSAAVTGNCRAPVRLAQLRRPLSKPPLHSV